MDERTTIADLERRLAVSETRHRRLIESWAQAVWESDGEGVVVADSPSWRAYTGQTREEWLGYGWLDAIHPDDRAYAERQWREAVAARERVDAEFRLHAPDGGWRWTNVRAAPVLDEGGHIEKWVGMNIDIDDRKRAEATLRESESRLRTLFDSIDEGYAEFDVILGEDGQVIDWRYVALNAAFTRQTGLDDVTGRLISEIVPDLEPAWGELYTRVIKTGEPIRFEQVAASLGQWYEVYASRSGGPESRRIVVVYNDITARKRAEANLRESEERQAFLLKLSDALRPLAAARDIREAACRMLGEHMNANRVYYVEYHAAEGVGVVADDFLTPGLPSLSGRYPFEAFRSTYERIFNGATWVMSDVQADTELPLQERDFYAAQKVTAWVNVPLAKGGVLEAALCVVQTQARRWTPAEINLIEEVAERLWSAIQRARAEGALRESEARFARFAASSSDVLWTRNAETLAVEFISAAAQDVFGISPKSLLGDPKPSIGMIVPDDRDGVFANIQRVRHGDSVVYDYRIRRADGAFRWMRSTSFPLFDARGRVEKIGGISSDVTETKLAAEHQGVLLAELQHRVRNIMALIRSITARTGERASSVPEYTDLLLGRLLAFARVQALLTRAANVSVGIASIVRDELGVQAQHEKQYLLDGPDVELSPKAAEVLTLAVHELATNAVKYGAFSMVSGKVTITWSIFEKRGRTWLAFDWAETGGPARPPDGADLP